MKYGTKRRSWLEKELQWGGGGLQSLMWPMTTVSDHDGGDGENGKDGDIGCGGIGWEGWWRVSHSSTGAIKLGGIGWYSMSMFFQNANRGHLIFLPVRLKKEEVHARLQFFLLLILFCWWTKTKYQELCLLKI